MKTITVIPSPCEYSFRMAQAGSIWHLNLHGCRWPAALRNNPPRVRLLHACDSRPVLCELLDPFPDAPAVYPPEWAPDAKIGPGSLYLTSPVWTR